MCTHSYFKVIMYFSMIEVGLLAQKWSAPQQRSATQRSEATVSPEAMQWSMVSHLRMRPCLRFKVRLIGRAL